MRPNQATLKFIEANSEKSVFDLALNKSISKEVDLNYALQQIEGRQKIKKKLPTWYENRQIKFPKKLSLEQASSELTALWKSNLVGSNLLVDLTGGFGVDSFFFSKKVSNISYVEQNTDLCKVVAYNFETLKAQNIKVSNTQAEEFLENIEQKVDWIYLDPARRNTTNQKVFLIEDCQPNIIELQQLLFQKSDQILIKLSPMLDIPLAFKKLEKVAQVIVLAVENEVKELLFILTPNSTKSPKLKAVNLLKNGKIQEFETTIEKEANSIAQFHTPLKYLYEPNASIMKIGAFKSISQTFKLCKLHPNTHLYTSNQRIENFPGRVFEIQKIIKPNKKEIRKAIPQKKINITVRNFPMSVAEIRKKFALIEGGNEYLFATINIKNEKILVLCYKLSNFKQ